MDHVIPGLDYPTGPYGRMADGTYRTCPHCGTVERALAPDPHVDCDCPCHKFRKGPYGRMADGTYRTCPHCGTVERALAPDPHVDCDCPCHKFRKGTLTVEERNWRRRKTSGR